MIGHMTTNAKIIFMAQKANRCARLVTLHNVHSKKQGKVYNVHHYQEYQHNQTISSRALLANASIINLDNRINSNLLEVASNIVSLYKQGFLVNL